MGAYPTVDFRVGRTRLVGNTSRLGTFCFVGPCSAPFLSAKAVPDAAQLATFDAQAEGQKPVVVGQADTLSELFGSGPLVDALKDWQASCGSSSALALAVPVTKTVNGAIGEVTRAGPTVSGAEVKPPAVTFDKQGVDGADAPWMDAEVVVEVEQASAVDGGGWELDPAEPQPTLRISLDGGRTWLPQRVTLGVLGAEPDPEDPNGTNGWVYIPGTGVAMKVPANDGGTTPVPYKFYTGQSWSFSLTAAKVALGDSADYSGILGAMQIAKEAYEQAPFEGFVVCGQMDIDTNDEHADAAESINTLLASYLADFFPAFAVIEGPVWDGTRAELKTNVAGGDAALLAYQQKTLDYCSVLYSMERVSEARSSCYGHRLRVPIGLLAGRLTSMKDRIGRHLGDTSLFPAGVIGTEYDPVMTRPLGRQLVKTYRMMTLGPLPGLRGLFFPDDVTLGSAEKGLDTVRAVRLTLHAFYWLGLQVARAYNVPRSAKELALLKGSWLAVLLNEFNGGDKNWVTSLELDIKHVAARQATCNVRIGIDGVVSDWTVNVTIQEV